MNKNMLLAIMLTGGLLTVDANAMLEKIKKALVSFTESDFKKKKSPLHEALRLNKNENSDNEEEFDVVNDDHEDDDNDFNQLESKPAMQSLRGLVVLLSVQSDDSGPFPFEESDGPDH